MRQWPSKLSKYRWRYHAREGYPQYTKTRAKPKNRRYTTTIRCNAKATKHNNEPYHSPSNKTYQKERSYAICYSKAWVSATMYNATNI